MNLQEALAWEAKNCDDASMERIRSRRVVKCLADEVRRLQAALKETMSYLGPSAPECCGCEVEWNGALKVIRGALRED